MAVTSDGWRPALRKDVNVAFPGSQAPRSSEASASNIYAEQRIGSGGQHLEITVREDVDFHFVREETVVDPSTGQRLSTDKMVANRILVGFDTHKDLAPRLERLANLGLTVLDVNHRIGVLRVRLADASIEHFDRTLEQVKAESLFSFAEPEFLLGTSAAPNDPYVASSGSWGQSFADMWGLQNIGMQSLWNSSLSLSQVVVAVVDSGVDINHPELIGRIWINPQEVAGNGVDDDGNGKIDDIHGWNFLSDTANVEDAQGHGTAVAGIIAATPDNGLGIAGVASNARIMALKNSHLSGSSVYDTAEALRYATDHGAKVVNLSLGGGTLSYTLDMAVTYARDRDVVLVASAGNDGLYGAVTFPANYEGVISVGAHRSSGERASFSNYGPNVDLMAPGQDILTLQAAGTLPSQPLGTELAVMSGTSYATPFVSALAALIRGVQPTASAAQVAARLAENPSELGAVGWDVETGKGGVSSRGVTASGPVIVADITSPANGRVVAGTVQITGTLQTAVAISGTLAIRRTSGTESDWVTLPSTTIALGIDRTLGSLDSSTFTDGSHVIRLRVEAGGTRVEDYQVITIGNSIPVATKLNEVDGSQKSAADLNGDGEMEIIHTPFRGIGVYSAKTGTYLSGWPQGSAPYNPGYPAPGGLFATYGHNYGAPAIADIDGDGSLEVALFFAPTNNQWADTVIEIFHASGQRVAGWPRTFVNGRTTNNQVVSPVLSDVDEDGKADLIYVSQTGTQAVVHVVRHDGIAAAGWPVTLPSGSGGSYVTPAVADLDGDGHRDVLVMDMNGTIHGLRYNGTTLVGWPLVHSSTASTKGFFLVSDFDGDSSLDVGVTYGGKVAIYGKTGVVKTGWPRTLSGTVGTPAVGDIDGDGRLELVVSGGSTQWVFTSDGANLPGWPLVNTGSLGMPILADMDDDGDIDIYNTSFDQKLLAWDSAGRVLTELGFPRTTRYFGQRNDIAGDFDGDGLLEISADKHDLGAHFLQLHTQVGSGRLEHSQIHVTLGRTGLKSRPIIREPATPILVSHLGKLTFTGKGFLEGMVVKLGAVTLPIDVLLSDSVTCSVPNSLPPGRWYLEVLSANFAPVRMNSPITVVSSLTADDDGDQLPNNWELQYGLDIFRTDSTNGVAGDADRDGLPNSIEHAFQRSGFSPTRKDSLERLMQAGQGAFRYTWSPNASVTPLWSVNLQQWSSLSQIRLWPGVSVSESASDNGYIDYFIRFPSGQYPHVFFRVTSP